MKKARKYASYLRFEEILCEKGLTLYRVAKDLGISPMTLSDWKHDKSKPKMEKMIKIAKYLGVDIEEFADHKEGCA